MWQRPEIAGRRRWHPGSSARPIASSTRLSRPGERARSPGSSGRWAYRMSSYAAARRAHRAGQPGWRPRSGRGGRAAFPPGPGASGRRPRARRGQGGRRPPGRGGSPRGAASCRGARGGARRAVEDDLALLSQLSNGRLHPAAARASATTGRSATAATSSRTIDARTRPRTRCREPGSMGPARPARWSADGWFLFQIPRAARPGQCPTSSAARSTTGDNKSAEESADDPNRGDERNEHRRAGARRGASPQECRWR